MDKPTCKTVGCERPATTRSGVCKPCWHHDYYLRNREYLLAQASAWHRANPESVAASRERFRPAMAEYGKTYYAANAAKIKAYHKAYYQAHAVKLAAQTKAYRAANADAVKAMSAAHYAANPERVIRRSKAWKLANPERASELSRESIGRRRARKNGTIVTKADYAVILAKYGMRCHICGLDILTRADLHFDHVIPLAKGGTHSPGNILPSHAFCNLSKGVRVI